MKYKVVAVDFDGTIVESKYPAVGPLIPRAKEVMQKYKNAGGQILIWTCRTDSDLDDAVSFLVANDIPFDAVNKHFQWQIDVFHSAFPHCCPDGRKLAADMYIDDKNPGGIDWDLVEKLLLEE